MSFLLTPEQLKKRIQEKNIAIIDVRSNLQNPDIGLKAYKKAHIPGAHFLHMEKDLSGEVKEHGGNHPLPDVNVFAQKLGELGITTDSAVVVYDDANNMFAPRAWWVLRYFGINQTFVLNGGYAAWENAGYEVTSDIPEVEPTIFNPEVKEHKTVSMEDVRDRDIDKSVLIDSRAYERYIGKVEPLYKKAGHIPGAKNYFWQHVLDETMSWKSIDVLQEHFASLHDADEIIVSCGSGISACPNILALEMAGFKNVKLYPGSFSDWISYDENPIKTNEE